ncbi:hypothetical protein J4Q44_G00165030 [Coregonus suidteri]|uniref:Uncharacterized protein n=1 Tax=Coregonus suidteri TaxID=861788 RepID=A0AAN8M707_9TELE
MSDALSDDASRGNDGQEDVMTPAELIGKLEEAWLNEKFSPELLENKSEMGDGAADSHGGQPAAGLEG